MDGWVDGWVGMLEGGGGRVLLLWLVVAKDVKGSEWNKLRSELRDPPGLQDFLSTDVWTPEPFDQISILRRIKFGGPPQVPKAPKCEVSENVSETGCQSTNITISLFYKQACKGTQSVT